MSFGIKDLLLFFQRACHKVTEINVCSAKYIFSIDDLISSFGSACVPSIGGKIETAWRQGCAEKSPKSPGRLMLKIQRIIKSCATTIPTEAGKANPIQKQFKVMTSVAAD